MTGRPEVHNFLAEFDITVLQQIASSAKPAIRAVIHYFPYCTTFSPISSGLHSSGSVVMGKLIWVIGYAFTVSQY